MEKLIGVDLSRTRDAEDGGRGTARIRPATESEVREVFRGSEPWSARGGVEGTEALRMGAIRQGHKRQKGPVIVDGGIDGGIDAVFDAKPAFYLRSPASG